MRWTWSSELRRGVDCAVRRATRGVGAPMRQVEIRDSLASFSLGSLPVLKHLSLYGCKNLKSISTLEEAAASQSLMFLESLTIEECPELKSISILGLSIAQEKCDKINSLPEPINNLSGLQELLIHELPNLQSIAEEGLPMNLRTLDVGNTQGVYSNTDITKWGLEQLTSLSELHIKGEYMVKKLMEMEVLLPNSLEALTTHSASEIQHMHGKWLQHLTSLKRLHFMNCHNLKSLPEEGLPSSISYLTMIDCPKLKESCQRNRGKEWPKIAHISWIVYI
ncbi:hypothetical protein PIB30_017476 [Stylosanthes scabra]|uniref:Uncharacterized protein n=1 Tax=Stylosanthes scabra TaxID=79078 RepID=A0ABU6Z604_9FABA|nr:hypothetical protein [Stylosanthes scabra]